MFTKKQLVSLIIPLLVEQVFNAVIGLADTVMVAQVGETAMSGVALVDSINTLLVNAFSAMATGGTIITSQYLGRRDVENGKTAAKQCVIVTTALATAICLLCLTFRREILRLVFGAVEQSVMDNALIYFLITAMTYPFVALCAACGATFRATRNSKLPMRVSIIMNIMNIAGNALLIFVFDMGAAGAALSTLISRIFAGAVMYIRLRDPKREVNVHNIFSSGVEWGMVKRILAIGVPTGLENSIFHIGKVLVQSIVSLLGTSSIAAASIAHNAAVVADMPGQAIGLAMMTVVGQCIGANKQDQAKRYAVGLTALSEGSILCVGAVMLVFLRPIIGIFGVAQETVEIARGLVICTVVGLMTVWPLGFTLPHALRAAGDVKFAMCISVISMWVFRVGLGYVLAIPVGVGALGIWLGMIMDWAFRATVFVFRYRSGRWLRHNMIKA